MVPPIQLPPSPPKSEEARSSRCMVLILRLLHNHYIGCLDLRSPWTEIPLLLIEYEELCRRIRPYKHLWAYLEHKLRYDYDPKKAKFIFRMPSSVHELFIKSIEHAFESQLSHISRAHHGSVALVAQKIISGRSISIHAPVTSDDPWKHDPDAQFYGRGRYPTVVVEVSYSQKRRALPHLADDYIVDTYGQIGLVIGLDIEYMGTKEGRLFMWRAELATENGQPYIEAKEVVSQVFRNADGTPACGTLSLCLRDFAGKELCETLSEEESSLLIEIPFTTLAQHLQESEEFYENQTEAPVPEPRPQKRKRRMTPPEELLSADETTFEEAAEAAERKTSEADSSFEGNDDHADQIPRRSRRLRQKETT